MPKPAEKQLSRSLKPPAKFSSPTIWCLASSKGRDKGSRRAATCQHHPSYGAEGSVGVPRQKEPAAPRRNGL